MARKRGYRGIVGKAILRGEFERGLEAAANRWVAGVSQAVNAYKGGLKDYLTKYIPAVEKAYLDAKKQYGYDTIDARLQVANAVAKATSELAKQYREKKAEDIAKKKMALFSNNIDGFALSYNSTGGLGPTSYTSSETPKKVQKVIDNVLTV